MYIFLLRCLPNLLRVLGSREVAWLIKSSGLQEEFGATKSDGESSLQDIIIEKHWQLFVFSNL